MNDYPDYPVPRLDSVFSVYQYIAETFSDETAFLPGNEEISYRHFKNDIGRAYRILRKKKKGFCLLKLKSKYRFAVMWFAAVLAGHTAVLMPPEMEGVRPPEGLEYSAVLTDAWAAENLPFASSCEIGADCGEEAGRPCTIVFSSGTSAVPKGVMLTPENICADLAAGCRKYFFGYRYRYLSILPFTHVFGLVVDMLAVLLAGGTIIPEENIFHFYRDIARYGVNSLNIPPVMAEGMLQLLKTSDKPSDIAGHKLTKVLCGGAGVSAKTAEELARYQIVVHGCYGSTECTAGVTISRDRYYRFGSAGVLMDCNEIRFAEDGEILVRGANVMAGYWGDRIRTAEVVRDGWFHTGDLGWMDKDGFLYVTGRKSSMIVLDDGTKVVPETIERRLSDIDGVKEALVSVHGTGAGQTLDALVVLEGMERQREAERAIYELNETIMHPVRCTFTQKRLERYANGKIIRKRGG